MSLSLGLQGLPFELLSSIVCNFESANTLLQLCLTCKRLHQYVKRDGYRTFVQARFPFTWSTPDWLSTARFLVALSRAWTNKAFIARDLRPDRSAPNSICLPTKPNNNEDAEEQRVQHQSMGYQPALDCFQISDRSYHTPNRHILAWGAGVELILRVTEEGSGAKAQSHLPRWTFWRGPEAVDGRDDIINLSLLRSHQVTQDGELQAIISRASGDLQHLKIFPEETRMQSLDTAGRSARSVHVSPASYPFLAAGLDGDIAIYKPQLDTDSWRIESEAPITQEDVGARTWTVKFLNDRQVATGRGPAFSALCVFDISSERINGAPLTNPNPDAKDSVYAIEPLPASRGASHLFLAAWYSGTVGLCDLRSPRNTILKYEDPIDPSAAVYSLCSFANDRFVAGGGRHSCIKVFDLRKPGRHTYAVNDLDEIYAGSQCLDHDSHKDLGRGYNIFLGHSGRSKFASPVYSLSKASEYSSSFYAGLENRVVQLDLYSLSDSSSRPSAHLPCASSLIKRRNGLNLEEMTNLGLVEHTVSGAHSMFRQIFGTTGGLSVPGWDPCWVKGALDDSQPRYQNSRHSYWPLPRHSRRGLRH